MKVIPETRLAQYIRYLCLIIPLNNISASALTWFIRCIDIQNLHFLNMVIYIKNKTMIKQPN
jgi:hypothetical protein